MEEILLLLGAIFAVVIAGFVAWIAAKGFWLATKFIWQNGPEFMGKVFVTLVAGLIAGFVGAELLNQSFQVSGGVGLAVGALTALRS